MIKKLGISLCLLLAFALLQAHNFIPHHHHEVVAEKKHHHHGDNKHHHHEDEGDRPDSEHNFPDLDHSTELGKVVSKPVYVKEVVQKPFVQLNRILWLADKLTAIESPPDYHPPDNDSPLHTIFLSHSVPLRAPPISSLFS